MRSSDGVSRLIKALLVVVVVVAVALLVRCGLELLRGEGEVPSLLFSWFLEEAEESVGTQENKDKK